MTFDVIGTTFMDVVVQAPESGFEPDNVVFSKNARITAGGNGCNLAINLARNNLDTSFFGCIGNDYPGDVIKKDFIKHGVSWDRTYEKETGISLVIVDKDGERSVSSFQGMNSSFGLSMLNFEKIKNDTAICGLGLLPSIENDLDTIIDQVHMSNKVIYAGTTGDTSVLMPAISKRKYRGLDFLFMNDLEAKRLCKMKNILDCGRFLTKSCGIKTVIITEGEKGATMISGKSINHVDGLKVECLDSTGAGDAFMAGFIKEYSRTRDSNKALNFANIAGSKNVQFFGAVK